MQIKKVKGQVKLQRRLILRSTDSTDCLVNHVDTLALNLHSFY